MLGYEANNTFRVGQGDLISPPQAQVSPLQFLGHQGVELQRRPKTCTHLTGQTEISINTQTQNTESLHA